MRDALLFLVPQQSFFFPSPSLTFTQHDFASPMAPVSLSTVVGPTPTVSWVDPLSRGDNSMISYLPEQTPTVIATTVPDGSLVTETAYNLGDYTSITPPDPVSAISVTETYGNSPPDSTPTISVTDTHRNTAAPYDPWNPENGSVG